MDNSRKTPFSLAGKKIWVAGQTGMVGSAVSKRLASEDCKLFLVKRSELDLRDQKAVRIWLNKNMPDVIVVAAGTVGGILANSSRPAEFLYDNLAIETNIILLPEFWTGQNDHSMESLEGNTINYLKHISLSSIY